MAAIARSKLRSALAACLGSFLNISPIPRIILGNSRVAWPNPVQNTWSTWPVCPLTPSGTLPSLRRSIMLTHSMKQISRASIREQLALHFPTLLPCFDLRYGHPSSVFFYNRALLAREGVQQGDPWRPILLALALQPALTKHRDEFPDRVTGAYLDDVYTVFPSASASCVPFFQAMAREGGKVGHTLRMKKSSIYSPSAAAHTLVTDVDRAAPQQIQAVDQGASPSSSILSRELSY